MFPEDMRLRHVASASPFDRENKFVFSDLCIKCSARRVARWQECDVQLTAFEDSIFIQVSSLDVFL